MSETGRRTRSELAADMTKTRREALMMLWQCVGKQKRP
jgi:hypothetical protein